MQLYESRLSYFNDKARINYCKSPSVHQHGGRSRPRQNCHSCIFETNENSNLRICIQYLGHHSKTTCQKSAKSMRYRVRPKFEFYRKSLLIRLFVEKTHKRQPLRGIASVVRTQQHAENGAFHVGARGKESGECSHSRKGVQADGEVDTPR